MAKEPEEHYKYSASQINRILLCPGSVDFIDYLKKKGVIPAEETSVYAEEGTMLHEQQELVLHNAPFTKELSAEQEDCLGNNLQWFLDKTEEHGITKWETEAKKDLSGFGINDAGGTADVRAEAALCTGLKAIHVFDWKFGQGVYVNCEKNKQCMTYLLSQIGSLESFKEYGEFWIHIGQPRLNNYSSYLCTKEELFELLEAIKAAQKSHEINPGQVQCLWCRGKLNCAEYHQYIQENAALAFSVSKQLQEANFIDFKKIAEILSYEPVLKKAFASIRERMATLGREELNNIGLKRVAGRSIRAFTNKEEVVKYLVEHYDIADVYAEPALKSPAQLEKTVPGLKKDKKFQSFIFKPTGNPTIVSISDKRPEFEGIGADKTFAHLKK